MHIERDNTDVKHIKIQTAYCRKNQNVCYTRSNTSKMPPPGLI